jgi:hypothetical protein
VQKVPIISTFYGIVIRMNFGDHNPPHFHAEYQGFQAAFDIAFGKLVAGELPTNAKKLVETWAKKTEDLCLQIGNTRSQWNPWNASRAWSKSDDKKNMGVA